MRVLTVATFTALILSNVAAWAAEPTGCGTIATRTDLALRVADQVLANQMAGYYTKKVKSTAPGGNDRTDFIIGATNIQNNYKFDISIPVNGRCEVGRIVVTQVK